MKRRLITSALPYVNNVPHLGNLIQVLSADVFARFCRLSGYETLYVCGTDEYGTATETKAAEEGVSPRELCNRFFDIHSTIYKWFNIAFDKFGRTSTPIQTEVTQGLFKDLDEAGLIAEHEIEQLFCAGCKRFLADRYVRGICPHCGSSNARGDQCEDCGKLLDPTELKESRCSSCGKTPRIEKTKHLYIDLPKIKPLLEQWIKKTSIEGFWANNAIQMTHAWIRDGLHERAITRDLKWGIPVPKDGYENKVFYVWFDAPIGYISITGNLGREKGGDWRQFVEYWWNTPGEVELFQFIGKDNIPFHTVIFPSTLLGSGRKWTMLHHMSSTEYLNYESGKFSKSRGIGVFGTDAMETGIPADVWRFYIFYNRPEKADTLFMWNDFQEKVNGELIGNLGNLVNRTLSFVSRYYDGKIPEGRKNSTFNSYEFWETIRKYGADIRSFYEKAQLRDAFRLVFEMSSFANKSFQDGEPWRKRKDDPAAAETLIRYLSYAVRDIAVLIEPYMPEAARKIASFFGLSFGSGDIYQKEDGLLSWDSIGKDTGLDKVVSSEVLFAKLEDDKIESLREKYSGTQKERADAGNKDAEPSAPELTLPEKFSRTIDLRAARIVKTERHPKADKLYILTLEVANAPGAVPEERIIVSGLVGHYTEDDLLGKQIIVAYNLKPAKLRGIESRGMLLAASDMEGQPDADGKKTERVDVLVSADITIGTRVGIEDHEPQTPPAQIDIGTFLSVPLEVEDGVVRCGGKALTLGGKLVRTGFVVKGEVH